MNLDVKVNPGPRRDEVFITSDPKAEEYVNRAIYAKPGIFTSGQFSAKHIEDLEKRSAAELAEDAAKALAAETKEREKAEAETTAAPKKAPPKKEEE